MFGSIAMFVAPHVYKLARAAMQRDRDRSSVIGSGGSVQKNVDAAFAVKRQNLKRRNVTKNRLQKPHCLK